MKKPTNQEFMKIFDGIAENYDALANNYTVKRRAEELSRWTKGEILEVGAGPGTISSFIEDKNRITLSDISPQMCRIAKKKLGCRVVCCDAEKLPFPDSSFDTVIASEMIYYLDNPRAFIIEAHRVLRPGGFFLISSANHQVARFYDKLRNALRALRVSGMYFDDRNREFSIMGDLTRMLEENNFTVRDKKKIVVLPFSFCDYANRLLENSFFGRYGLFIIIKSIKGI